MIDVTQPFANFASFLKNYTATVFYGITCTGKMFTLAPENSVIASQMMGSIVNNGAPGEQAAAAMGVNSYSGIFVLSCGKQSADMIYSSVIDGKWYKTPTQGEPVYIDDLNVILFATEQERFDAVDKYGDASKLVKAMAANALPLINGSYIVVSCLNKDAHFYMVHDRSAHELPAETDTSARDYIKKYGIEPEMLETHYVFIVSTIFRNGLSKKPESTTPYTEIKRVEKNSLIKGEPLIFQNIGVVLFESVDSANEFLEKYGILSNYLVKTALDATHSIRDKELEELNERVAKDKRGMVETFGIMGGSSAVSVLVENLIKSANNDDKDASKKAVKAFVIGILALGSVFGAYKAYRYWDKKKSEKK